MNKCKEPVGDLSGFSGPGSADGSERQLGFQEDTLSPPALDRGTLVYASHPYLSLVGAGLLRQDRQLGGNRLPSIRHAFLYRGDIPHPIGEVQAKVVIHIHRTDQHPPLQHHLI